MSTPLVVLVSGAPGTGKTALLRDLAPRLGLPVIAKDDIKESLGDTLGTTTRVVAATRRRDVGAALPALRAAARRRHVLYRRVELLDAQQPSPLPRVDGAVSRSSPVEVHCFTTARRSRSACAGGRLAASGTRPSQQGVRGRRDGRADRGVAPSARSRPARSERTRPPSGHGRPEPSTWTGSSPTSGGLQMDFDTVARRHVPFASGSISTSPVEPK